MSGLTPFLFFRYNPGSLLLVVLPTHCTICLGQTTTTTTTTAIRRKEGAVPPPLHHLYRLFFLAGEKWGKTRHGTDLFLVGVFFEVERPAVTNRGEGVGQTDRKKLVPFPDVSQEMAIFTGSFSRLVFFLAGDVVGPCLGPKMDC